MYSNVCAFLEAEMSGVVSYDCYVHDGLDFGKFIMSKIFVIALMM
jgi:hypothetical protein